MSRSAVVRNYAETLLELAVRDDAVEAYGDHIEEVGALYRLEEDFRRFLETPGVSLEEKKEAIRKAWGGRAPERFVRFLLLTLDKRRQRELPRIAGAYRELRDEKEGRVHATVTLAREPDDEFRKEIARALDRAVEDHSVVPEFRVDEEIVGGVIIRMEDYVMDGSLRRRLADLERSLLEDREGRRAG